MRENGFQALAMLGRCTRARSTRHADDKRHTRLAAKHETDLGSLVDDLLRGQQRKVGELKFQNRPHAGQRRPHRHTRHAKLGNRRVDHTLGTKAVDQITRHAKGPAIGANIFAKGEHTRIGLHRLSHRFTDGLGIGEFAHFRLGSYIKHKHLPQAERDRVLRFPGQRQQRQRFHHSHAP